MTEIQVLPIERLEMTFAPKRWSFADQRRAEIDAHFGRLREAKPALWNGRVLLLHQYEIADRALRGSFFETDFATFMAWRDWGFPDVAAFNCFAMGALQSADGAFLLGVMAEHTANAGSVYFPSGTPDPSDVQGNDVALDGSVSRELEEETGLRRQNLAADAGWHAVLAGRRIALMKTLRAHESAAELRAKIVGNLARQRQPELSEIRIVRGPADIDSMMPEFVKAFLQHAWAASAQA
jgi:hypothetical protein